MYLDDSEAVIGALQLRIAQLEGENATLLSYREPDDGGWLRGCKDAAQLIHDVIAAANGQISRDQICTAIRATFELGTGVRA